MKVRVVLIVLALGVVTVAILLYQMAGQFKEHASALAARGQPKALALAEQKAVGGGAASIGKAPAPQLPPPAAVDPEFQRWIAEEAKDINQASLDSQAKKIQMAKVVKELTPIKERQLLQTARISVNAGERILSTYLLVEGGATGLLQELITAPVANPGPFESHSQGEMELTQERAIRLMALEGMISRAEHDPAVRIALEQTIPGIPDPYIKAYAQKHLDEIKTH